MSSSLAAGVVLYPSSERFLFWIAPPTSLSVIFFSAALAFSASFSTRPGSFRFRSCFYTRFPRRLFLARYTVSLVARFGDAIFVWLSLQHDYLYFWCLWGYSAGREWGEV